MNYGFDSQEEVWFSAWLHEAQEKGYVIYHKYHPSSFLLSVNQTYKVEKQLKTKVKVIHKHLLRPHWYQTDFKVAFSKSFLESFKTKLYSTGEYYWIDIKGVFAGRNNTSAVTFPLNQKWVYEKYNVFVNKVVPERFFKHTWVPQSVRVGKSGKVLKKWINYPILE